MSISKIHCIAILVFSYNCIPDDLFASGEDVFPMPVPKSLILPDEYKLERSYQSGPLCGPNSAYTVLRIYGQQVDYKEVVASFQVDPIKGVSIYDLSQVLSKYGLMAEARKNITPEDILKSPFPLILHINSEDTNEKGDKRADHFYVVTGVSNIDSDDPYVTYVDTTNLVGMRTTLSMISKNMSGYCVVFNEYKTRGKTNNNTIITILWVLLSSTTIVSAVLVIKRRRR